MNFCYHLKTEFPCLIATHQLVVKNVLTFCSKSDVLTSSRKKSQFVSYLTVFFDIYEMQNLVQEQREDMHSNWEIAFSYPAKTEHPTSPLKGLGRETIDAVQWSCLKMFLQHSHKGLECIQYRDSLLFQFKWN